MVDCCPLFKTCQEQVKNIYKDYEYRFYDDSEMMNYVKTNFNNYYDIFYTLPPIMQCDIFRYFLMYKEGGLYCDMDYLWFKNIPETNKKCLLMEEITTNDKFELVTNISNCVFVSEKGVMFWIDSVDLAFERIKIWRENPNNKNLNNVLKLTGPFLLDDVYRKKYYGDEDIKTFPPEMFNSEDFNKTQVLNKFIRRSYWSSVSTCSTINHPRTQKMIQKFKNYQGNDKYYGIHMHAHSWFGNQKNKYASIGDS